MTDETDKDQQPPAPNDSGGNQLRSENADHNAIPPVLGIVAVVLEAVKSGVTITLKGTWDLHISTKDRSDQSK
jgi:hypothetical protein